MQKTSEKVALFVPSLGGGGAERVMVLLANGLADAGYEVDLVVVNAHGSHREALSAQVRLMDLHKPRVLAAMPGLIAYLRREKPRVMISALDYANVVALLATRLACVSTKLIITEHSTLSIASEKDFRGRGRLLPTLMQLTYPWADQILAVSQGVADDLANKLNIKRSKIAVAYNPVVTEQLSMLAAQEVQWPWPRVEGIPFILATGRLAAAKDFSTLLKAFSILRKKRSAKLLILGEGEERGMLEQKIAQYELGEDVALPGFVSNPYAWMASADLFVMSSRWEGLPTVLIEAMACGAPIVSTDCPSGPAEILENGKWGRLVAVGDGAALAEAMDASILDADRHPGLARAQDFSVKKSVLKYMQFIKILSS